MKKMLRWPAFVLLLAFLFPLSGCHLIDLDDIIHHPDKIPQLCDIKKLTYTNPGSDGEDPLVTTLFYYNKWGNPDSIISDLSQTGHPGRYYFRYDKQRRLVEYISMFDIDNGGYWNWSRYQYDDKNRVVSDSTYSFGLVVNGQPQYPDPVYRFKSEYTYDAYDRVIQATYYYINNNIHQVNYSYDSQGNRQRSGSTVQTYDNKVNILRTNKVWMFLMLDYSIHNPQSAIDPIMPADYNKYGLPLKLPENTRFLDFTMGDNITVTYKCK